MRFRLPRELALSRPFLNGFPTTTQIKHESKVATYIKIWKYLIFNIHSKKMTFIFVGSKKILLCV